MDLLFFADLSELPGAYRQQNKRGRGGSLVQREKLKNISFSRTPCIAEERGFGVFIQIYNALVVMVSKHYIMGLKQEQWPGAVI